MGRYRRRCFIVGISGRDPLVNCGPHILRHNDVTVDNHLYLVWVVTDVGVLSLVLVGVTHWLIVDLQGRCSSGRCPTVCVRMFPEWSGGRGPARCVCGLPGVVVSLGSGVCTQVNSHYRNNYTNMPRVLLAVGAIRGMARLPLDY